MIYDNSDSLHMLVFNNDAFQPLTQMGYTFITSTAADGLKFGGDPFYVNCADDDLNVLVSARV